MKRILVLLLFSVLISGNAFAQEKGEEHREETPLSTVFKWFNAALLFGGLAYLLRKPAAEFFENRKKQITSGLERARDAQVSANARMDEIEQRLATLSAAVALSNPKPNAKPRPSATRSLLMPNAKSIESWNSLARKSSGSAAASSGKSKKRSPIRLSIARAKHFKPK